MGAKDNSDEYSTKEAKERMVAALRGARLAGHVPMKAKKKPKAKKTNEKQPKVGKLTGK